MWTRHIVPLYYIMYITNGTQYLHYINVRMANTNKHIIILCTLRQCTAGADTTLISKMQFSNIPITPTSIFNQMGNPLACFHTVHVDIMVQSTMHEPRSQLNSTCTLQWIQVHSQVRNAGVEAREIKVNLESRRIAISMANEHSEQW